MSGSEVEVRPLTGFGEFRECVRLQEEIWGAGFSQRVPEAILIIASRIGGVVSGAFGRDGVLLGFVFGITGIEEGHPVHWSDMLAVRAGWRRRGIGKALKLHQREELLRAGVTRMYWTFDPLEAGNARLNLSRLGAVVREYVEEMYGESGSPLHAEVGTDRFVAIWEMASGRVERRLGKGDEDEVSPDLKGVPSALEVVRGDDGIHRPGEARTELRVPRLLVPIPGDVQELKAKDTTAARSWRLATRRVLGSYLARGWEVREAIPEGNLLRYVLVRK